MAVKFENDICDRVAVARFTGFRGKYTLSILGLTPQALCFRLLRRLTN